MKIVKRVGVFETNSSSTHSIVFKQMTEEEKMIKEVEPGYSFEIRSKLCKIVFLFGLINNAEESYSCFINDYDEKKYSLPEAQAKELRQKRIDAVKKIKKEYGFDEDYLDNIDTYLDYELMYEISFEYGENSELLPQNLEIYETKEYQDYYRCVVLKFKDAVIKKYCELESITSEEADWRFRREGARFNNRDSIPKDFKDPYYKKTYYTTNFYKLAKEKNISIDEAIDITEENDAKDLTEYCCTRYFTENCLDYCDCNFGTYMEIFDNLINNLALIYYDMEKAVNTFLSDDYKFVMKELYCGMILECTKKIY